MKITLSLSGGGLRGAAHVGAIKFLEVSTPKYLPAKLFFASQRLSRPLPQPASRIFFESSSWRANSNSPHELRRARSQSSALKS